MQGKMRKKLSKPTLRTLRVITKDIKSYYKNEFHMFKKQKERWSILSRDMEYIRKTQIKLLEMKTTMSHTEIHWMAPRAKE